MRHKLTDRYIQTVRPPGSGRLVVADTEVTGLTLRVTPNGTRSFVVRYRPRLRPQKNYTVPSYPVVTLADARRRARDILAAAKRGVDLIADEQRQEAERRKTQASARNLRELAAEYVERACRPHQRRWRVVDQRLQNHVVPVLGDKMVRDIRRADIVKLLDTMAHEKSLRQQVNRTRSTLGTMFQYAIEREYLDDNPVLGTRPRKVEQERQRILGDAELRAIWLSLEKLPEPGRSFTKTLFFTAARRDEVRCAEWREISPDGEVCTLPPSRNKSNREFEVPLPKPMAAILASIPRNGAYIFTLDGQRPWTSLTLFKADLDALSGVSGWVFHDIRRTVRSRLAELSVPFEVAERVLNHAMTKLERTYNRHSYRQEKAQALQRWADHLLGLVHADPAKVVPMRRSND